MARILIVDAEEYIRHYYTEDLSDEGHQIVTLASGNNLMETIESLQPEVVVPDIKLVDYDGLDLLQKIHNRYLDLPVILCTAYDTYKYERKAMAADYYVVKSFHLLQLKMTIQKAIEATTTIRLN